MTGATLGEWLESAPFALGMSSGFFGFFAHCGVLRALEEQALLPHRVAGSSAGALVTAAWASGLPSEALATELEGLTREDFWDPGLGFGVLRGALFRERLERMLPVADLSECRVPACMSVYDVGRRRIRVLDHGPIAPAVQASCAVPLMFHPVRHAGGLLIDGGVADRAGLTGLRAEPRVLFHHLASRSPWRRRGSKALELPRRRGLVSLVIEQLPRVGAFRLKQGHRALAQAYTATRRALARPILRGVVRVTG